MIRFKNILFSSLSLLLVLGIVHSSSAYTYSVVGNELNENEYVQPILSTCERKVDDGEFHEDIIIADNVSIPNLSQESEDLLEDFGKEYRNNAVAVKQVLDVDSNKEVTRVVLEDAQIDFDKSGNIVKYKNFDDYSKAVPRRNYVEGEELKTEYYELDEKSDLSDIISRLEEKANLSGYKLIDCSNNIQGIWSLTWCWEYENNLINPYKCVCVIVDAKDGSISLYGKNDIEPNSTKPVISKDEAIKYAKEIIDNYEYEYEDENIDVILTFTRPNFFFEEGGPYEMADFVRLCWKVSLDSGIIVDVDAETGEILGGSYSKSVSARAMFVENFGGSNPEKNARAAYAAFNRLGYDQTNYCPVYWRVNQVDMDWILAQTDMYGLYLSCHGDVTDDLSENFLLATTANNANQTWTLSSNKNYGIWRFVYLDACLSSCTNNFANAFNCTNAGECFVGWNVIANVAMTEYFNERFFARLGSMPVYNAVWDTLWETRLDGGYNTPPRFFKDTFTTICDPGFIGDSNYYGWAW